MQVTLLELLFKIISEKKQIWLSVQFPFSFLKSSCISDFSTVVSGMEHSSQRPALSLHCLCSGDWKTCLSWSRQTFARIKSWFLCSQWQNAYGLQQHISGCISLNTKKQRGSSWEKGLFWLFSLDVISSPIVLECVCTQLYTIVCRQIHVWYSRSEC